MLGLALVVGPIPLDWLHHQQQSAAYHKQLESFESKIPDLARLYPTPRLLRKDLEEVLEIGERLERSGDPRAAKMDVLLASFLLASHRRAKPGAFPAISEVALVARLPAQPPVHRDPNLSPEVLSRAAALLDQPSALKPSLKVKDVLLNPLLWDGLAPEEGLALLRSVVPDFAGLPADAQAKLAAILRKLPPGLAPDAAATRKEANPPQWVADAVAAGVDLERVPENEKPGDEPPAFSLQRSAVTLFKPMLGGVLLLGLALGSLVGLQAKARAKPVARATRWLSQQRAAKEDKQETPRAAQLAPQSPARHKPLKDAIAQQACLTEKQETPRAAQLAPQSPARHKPLEDAIAPQACLTEKQETPRRTDEAIAQRAYQLYLARDKAHGHDKEDWLQAERELSAKPPESQRATN